MSIAWVALNEQQRNAFLLQNDPNQSFGKEEFGFRLGWHDADGDGIQDAGEKISFFKEASVKNQVYVLTVSANGDGTFKTGLSLKNADGSLTALSRDNIVGSNPQDWWAALCSDRLTLNTNGNAATNNLNLEYLNKELNSWATARASSVTQPVNFSIDTKWFDGGNGWSKYYGWTESDKTKQFLQQNSRLYKANEQGQLCQDGIGGWGGYVNLKLTGVSKGGSIVRHLTHFVNSYAAYEAALSGKNYTAKDFYNKDNQNWAENNGLIIGKVTVNGMETMGFTATQNGYTVSFYWDQQAGCNRIGKVTDSSGKDVTSSVLAQQGSNQFGKDWTSIKATLVLPSASSVGGANFGTYGNEFKPEYTGGSAEAPTLEETEALKNFMQVWTSCIDSSGRIARLPSNPFERSVLLADLKLLNAGDALKLFTANKSEHISSGLALLNDLVKQGTASDMNWLAVTVGKIVYLTGRELGRNAGKSGATEKEKSDFYSRLQSAVLGLVSTMAFGGNSANYDIKAHQNVLSHFMLGLRNYTEADGTVNSDMLTPANLVQYLANQLADAADMGAASYTAANARVLSSFMIDVIKYVAMFIGISSCSGLSDEDYDMRAGHFLRGGLTEDGVQRLIGLAFGQLLNRAYESTAAQKVFSDMVDSSVTESRKLQDALMLFYKTFCEGINKLLQQSVGAN